MSARRPACIWMCGDMSQIDVRMYVCMDAIHESMYMHKAYESSHAC